MFYDVVKKRRISLEEMKQIDYYAAIKLPKKPNTNCRYRYILEDSMHLIHSIRSENGDVFEVISPATMRYYLNLEKGTPVYNFGYLMLSKSKETTFQNVKYTYDGYDEVAHKNFIEKAKLPEEIRKQRYKKYMSNDDKREKKNLKVAEWRSRNKDKIRKYNNDYTNNRRSYDQNFKIRMNIRARIRLVLKGKIKSGGTMELLGCSMDGFNLHMSSQFTEGMTWENYGKWEIDHIIPCCSFDLSDPEQQKKCFHYTNLQPLWKEDNLAKRITDNAVIRSGGSFGNNR